MNLLENPWIPVRAGNGTGSFRLLTLEELLCHDGNWRVSLPRDDLELACIQLLVCMVQVMFLPETDQALFQRVRTPLRPEELADGIQPCSDWFDLTHPTQPFMQTRGVKAAEDTPIQKLLVGLPEGNNHAFFNEPGEVRHLSGAMTAIALFNQASNCPSFGGGFKSSLRGGGPITTLVSNSNLRGMIWRNVITLPRLCSYLPGYEPDHTRDRPTWVDPIKEKQVITSGGIGLTRGLFWQPAHVELVPSQEAQICDLIGGDVISGYTGFRKEKFNFSVTGLWSHIHGVRLSVKKAGVFGEKFASFTTSAPAWTHLSEFVVAHPLIPNSQEGSVPAAPVHQADIFEGALHLLVGGYRTNKASIVERRHDFFSLAEGWEEDGRDRVEQLVKVGLDAKKALRGKLFYASQGDDKKGMKGIAVPMQEIGEKLFYARTENLFHETLQEKLSRQAWKTGKCEFVKRTTEICREIYTELTDPYGHKPELLPIIAWARRSLNIDLAKLTEEA